jgi:rSAM/selenodomain-associated transferase 2
MPKQILENKISIIIPVFHEEDYINTTIMNVKKIQSNTPFEIIVVDGGKDKNTIRMIKDKDVVLLHSKQGRGTQLNHGSQHAKGSILLFLHADTILPSNAFDIIIKTVANTSHVGGAFSLSIDSDKRRYKIISGLISYRSKITRVPYGDQAIFIKKEYFDQIGGFRNIPLMEDVELMRRIKKNRGKIQIMKLSVKTSPRRWMKEGIVYCTLRNLMIRFLFYGGVPASKLVKYYK